MALVITNFDMSILFCNRLAIVYFIYLIAFSLSPSAKIVSRTLSKIYLIKRQLSLRTVSIPFLSILSYFYGRV